MNQLTRAYYTFLPILAAILPAYTLRVHVLGVPTNVFEIAVGVACGIGLLLPEIRSTWAVYVRSMPKGRLFAIAVFLASACVATYISSEARASLGILKGWFFIPAVASLLLASAVQSKNIAMRAYIDALIVSGVVVALFGISQIGTVSRVRSLYDVPNSLALFLVPVSIIALYTGVQLKKRFNILAAISMGIAILATESAGAVGAVVAVLCVWWALEKRRIAVLWALTAVLCMALAAFIYSGRAAYLVSPLIHAGSTNSITVRMQLWNIGRTLIRQHPFLGVGLGQFEPAYQAELHHRFAIATSPAPQPEYVFRDPHNWIISFWVNLGLLGLVSFIALNTMAIRRAITQKNIEQRAMAYALIAMLLFGLVDTVYWKNDLSALWWLLI